MMCQACAEDHHELCGMQTWCQCDCEGPEGVYYNDDPMGWSWHPEWSWHPDETGMEEDTP